MTRKIKVFVIAISIVLILIGLFAGISVSITFGEKSEQKAYVEDFDYMCNVIESEFIFLPLLAGEGIDYEAVKSATRVEIESQDMTIEQFYSCINNMLSNGLESKAHITVLSPKTYEEIVACEDEYSSEEYMETFHSKQTEETYKNLLSSDDFRNVKGDSHPYEVCGRYVEEYHTVIFYVPSFVDSDLVFDDNTVEDYLEGLGEKPIDHIVFDITGNKGGYCNCWMENIVAPFGGKYEWDQELYFRASDILRNHLLGNCSLDSKEEVHGVLPGIGIDSVIEEKYEICATPEKYQNAKRWVLVDEDVFSAADAFTAFCKNTGWATVVGRKTAGDGSAKRIAVGLPNTGLIIAFSVMTTLNDKGDGNVVCGTNPDILAKPKEEPLQTFYRYINTNKAKEVR